MVVHNAEYSQGTSAKVSGILETVTGHVAHGTSKMCRILKGVIGSFGLDCILLTQGQYSGSLLWNLGVASLIIIGYSSVFSGVMVEEIDGVRNKESRYTTRVNAQRLLDVYLNMSFRSACFMDWGFFFSKQAKLPNLRSVFSNAGLSGFSNYRTLGSWNLSVFQWYIDM